MAVDGLWGPARNIKANGYKTLHIVWKCRIFWPVYFRRFLFAPLQYWLYPVPVHVRFHDWDFLCCNLHLFWNVCDKMEIFLPNLIPSSSRLQQWRSIPRWKVGLFDLSRGPLITMRSAGNNKMCSRHNFWGATHWWMMMKDLLLMPWPYIWWCWCNNHKKVKLYFKRVADDDLSSISLQ